MVELVILVGMPKAACTSIEHYLFGRGGQGRFSYQMSEGINHNQAIQFCFDGESLQYERNPDALKKPSRCLGKIITSGGNQVLSAKSITDLDLSTLMQLRAYFLEKFATIRVVGYVGSPESCMTADFTRRIKHYGLSEWDLDQLWPRYRQTLEKLDRVFGCANVTLRPVRGEAIVNGDVVRDFCDQLGESIGPESIGRRDESLSLEAIAVLYAYRKYGVRYQPYPEQAADNRALIEMLSTFGSRKLRFADSVVDLVVERNREDLAWIEDRLGVPLREEGATEEGAIASELDLLEVAVSSLDQLKQLFLEQLGRTDPAPQQIANWMEKLRIAVTGRASHGAEPAQGVPGFFTPEQRERLTSQKIGPAVALRELAQAFERAGRFREATNCLRAALELRPDSRGLRALHRRVAEKAERGA